MVSELVLHSSGNVRARNQGGLPEVDGLMGHTIINTHQHDTMFVERYRYLLPKHENKYVKKTARSIPSHRPIHTPELGMESQISLTNCAT